MKGIKRAFIVLCIIWFILPLYAEENLLPNGDFEEGKEFPAGWGKMVEIYPGIKLLPSDPRYGKRVKQGVNLLWVKREKGGKCILFLLDEEAPPYTSISEVEGMTFASQMVKIEPERRYIIEVEVKSTGPEGIVFVKGYRKLPSGGATRGEISPQTDIQEHREKFQERYRATLQFHIKEYGRWKKFSRSFRIPFPEVKWIIVNLYAYGKRGRIWFDNVRLFPEK